MLKLVFKTTHLQHTHTRAHTHTHITRPRCPSPRLREITATWSGTLSIMRRPPKAPQVSFNMSKGPLLHPRLSMWPFIRPQRRTSKQNTSPGLKPSQLHMHMNYSAWCSPTLETRQSHCDMQISLKLSGGKPYCSSRNRDFYATVSCQCVLYRLTLSFTRPYILLPFSSWELFFFFRFLIRCQEPRNTSLHPDQTCRVKTNTMSYKRQVETLQNRRDATMRSSAIFPLAVVERKCCLTKRRLFKIAGKWSEILTEWRSSEKSSKSSHSTLTGGRLTT